MSRNEQITSEQSEQNLPKTYLDLIEKVGSIGKYQYLLTFVIGLTWYSTGIILMSTAFLFLNPQFDCQSVGLLTQDCYQYVCSLPQQQWSSYVSESSKNFKSLANSFGDYFCDDQIYLNLYASCPYLGALIGYITVSFFADNYGRKKTSIWAWSACCLGCLILMLSQNLWMAGIGLFLAGFGSDSVLNITSAMIAQQFGDYHRQRYYTIIQGVFTFGALFVTLVYYLWQSWFITVAFFLFIPSLITLACIIKFVKESPLYLLRDSPENALKQLNEIGFMNKKIQNILSIQELQNVIEHQESKHYQEVSTPLDVFRYSSLRLRTIIQAIVSISTYLLYYGPSLIIDQFGFDIYTSNVILNVADLLTYYPLMLIINKVHRKKTCMIQFGLASIISVLLFFLVKPDNCQNNCAIIYIQLVLIFIFRFLISMEFALMNVYQAELYPIRVRNIAGGVLGVFGTVASTTSPLLMGVLTRAGINHFILFALVGFIATSSFSFSPETLGQLCPQQIQQIQYEKYKKSKKSHQSFEKLHLK